MWSSGFAYAYELKGEWTARASINGVVEENVEKEGPSLVWTEVLSTSGRLDGNPAYIVGWQGEGTGPVEVIATNMARAPEPEPATRGLQVVRKSDLLTIQGSTNGGENHVAVSEISPGTFLDFPLADGKSWEGGPNLIWSRLLFGEAAMLVNYDIHAQVRGLKTLDLPVGRTETIEVEFRYTPTNLDKWVNSVRASAQESGVHLSKLEVSAQGTVRAFFSDLYQNVVRLELRNSLHMRVAGSGDGEEFDIILDLQGVGDQQLAGARLLRGPERTLDEVAAFLGGVGDLLDPTGTRYVDSDYDIALSADKTVVNAALGETVTFQVVPDGNPIPADHQPGWNILDGHANIVASGTGLSFAHAFDEPGAYRVEAVVVDPDGAIAASDAVAVIANYEKTETRVCAPITPPGATILQCGEVPLPVRPGIRSILVEATPDGALDAALPSPDVDIFDATGVSAPHDDSASGNTYAAKADRFNPGAFSTTGDWTAEYTRPFGVLGNVDYAVTLDYGAEAESPTEEIQTILVAPRPRSPNVIVGFGEAEGRVASISTDWSFPLLGSPLTQFGHP